MISTEKEKELISVIVPVYQVQEYLEKCVKSILNQTYGNIEIILVDDGSTDNSPKMCDELADSDKRIKVIHKENGGLSSARNAGLKAAQGVYVGFVDSDDWIEPDMYEYLHSLIKKYDADFAAIEMEIVKNRNKTFMQEAFCENVLMQDELFKLFFRVTSKDIHYCVCDKLIRRDKASNFIFWEGMRFEDIDYNFNLIQVCSKGVFSTRKMYYYYYNNSGITRNQLTPADMQLIVVWKNICQKCKQQWPEYVYFARMNYERAYMGILAKGLKFGVADNYKDWKKDKKILLKHLRKYAKDLLFWKMPVSRKILLLILCCTR